MKIKYKIVSRDTKNQNNKLWKFIFIFFALHNLIGRFFLYSGEQVCAHFVKYFWHKNITLLFFLSVFLDIYRQKFFMKMMSK